MDISNQWVEAHQQRRAEVLKKMAKGSLLVIPSAKTWLRNNDAEYPFRQDSDFWYLSGFVEDQAILLLEKDSEGECQSRLFCLEKDPKIEVWTGKRLGPDEAKKTLQWDNTAPISEFEPSFKESLKGKEQLYWFLGRDVQFDQQILSLVKQAKAQQRSGISVPKVFSDAADIVHELRLLKSPLELEKLKEVARISAKAHIHLMQRAQPGKKEYELAADFSHYCLTEGCQDLAYQSIVASGNNACTLHYVANRDTLEKEALVLVDAGGELDGYAADITRTFPANGQFTEHQKTIYEIVLKAQLAGIKAVKPGNRFDDIQSAILVELVSGLVQVGILSGDVTSLIESKAYEPFYMHKSGHWLGLDVHDVGQYKAGNQWRTLEPGMYLTVEPGLYLDAENTEIEPCWRGIGVRIEDDVLVTEQGCDILTDLAPKTVEEIEAVMLDART